MRQDRQGDPRSGLSVPELLALAVCLGLLAAMAIPSLGLAKRHSKAALCAGNIRGIVQAMYIYAQSNRSTFPATPGPMGKFYSNCPQPPANGGGLPATSAKLVADWYGNGRAPGGRDLGNPLACLWMIVINGQLRPTALICPADPIAARPSLLLRKGDPQDWHKSVYYCNFGITRRNGRFSTQGKGESYSIAYPWRPANGNAPARVGRWWTINDGADVPVVSDMAPADIKAPGKFDRDTTRVPPQAVLRSPLWTQPVPGKVKGAAPGPAAGGLSIYNSGNHRGAGQNVGFGDDHVAWETGPYCGQENDNIFTYALKPYSDGFHERQTGLRGIGARAPAPAFLSQTPPFDTCMVPVRNVRTGAW